MFLAALRPQPTPNLGEHENDDDADHDGSRQPQPQTLVLLRALAALRLDQLPRAVLDALCRRDDVLVNGLNLR